MLLRRVSSIISISFGKKRMISPLLSVLTLYLRLVLTSMLLQGLVHSSWEAYRLVQQKAAASKLENLDCYHQSYLATIRMLSPFLHPTYFKSISIQFSTTRCICMNVSEMFQILLYLVCCSSQGVVQLNFDVI